MNKSWFIIVLFVFIKCLGLRTALWQLLKSAMRNFSIVIVSIICVLLFENSSICALEQGSDGFASNLVIRQERLEINGVLISRPSPLDERIRDIVVFNHIKSIEDYAQWLGKNIKYRKDENGDNWSPPEETLQKRYGDCEDYAFFNQAVLERLGFKTRVLAVGGLFGNHAICVFEENGRYSWIDNHKLKRSQAQSIPEFARYLFSRYRCSYILSLDLATKNWQILFKRSEMGNQVGREIASQVD